MPDGAGGEKMLSYPYPVQGRHFHAHCPATGRRFTHDLGVKKDSRVRQQLGETYVNEKPADPSLNLEFVDEALNLVRDAEEKGIRLRILGSVAYRLPCPNNLHLFQDTKRALTDVDFGAEKNRTGQSANSSSRADMFRMKASTWRQRADATPICTRTPG
jgi:hypothetical protein